MNRAEEGQGSSSSQKRNDSQEIRKEYLAMKDAPCCKEKCLENISFYDLLQLRMNMNSKSRVNRRQFVLDYLTVNPSLTFTYLVLTFAAHHGSLLMRYPVMFIENATLISSRIRAAVTQTTGASRLSDTPVHCREWYQLFVIILPTRRRFTFHTAIP